MRLTDFLLARIAEDEVRARHTDPKRGRVFALEAAETSREVVEGAARLYENAESLPDESSRVAEQDALHAVLLRLAQRYTDHPDFDEDWRS